MRRHICVLMLALSAVGCERSVNLEQERNAVLARDREWAQSTKDPNKFMSFMAQDATVYAPGEPAQKGAATIRTKFEEMSRAPGFSLTWTPDKADVAKSGDIAYTTGSYEVTMAGGAEKGKYVAVWKKQSDGSWKVTDDIFNPDAPPQVPHTEHAMVAPSAVKWGAAPPSLPPGAHFAVIAGDPSQAQPFVMRLQVPAGYRIAPHWHPTDENVTVVSGTVSFGMGDTFDEAAMQDLPAGGFAILPAKMPHYFMAKTPATVQVHGMGPFAVNYVNPADDPSKE
jgi:ketosteroid isomerase-like protein/quercetin dioxygenase-like cupin family protein